MFDIKILRKQGWMLNPNDKVVTGILKGLMRCDGHCPCHHPERHGHDECPCHEYLAYDNCICGLYIKEDSDE